jgi:phosphomannomutase
MINYIFDIDGTLTPSRLKMHKEFELFFIKWMENKNVFLVTGSDKDKTIEQTGLSLWKKANRVYQSCGNQVWEKGVLIKENPFHLDSDMQEYLNSVLQNSKWNIKFGNHFEQRVGLVNFSIIGRNCNQKNREEYYKWDQVEKERIKICESLMHKFPHIEASVGGQISIDIHKKGKNKAQIIDDIIGEVYFFGDKMDKGGNDYPIANRLISEKRKHRLFKVNNPSETWDILQKIN